LGGFSDISGIQSDNGQIIDEEKVTINQNRETAEENEILNL
jgi:hypothetical protein